MGLPFWRTRILRRRSSSCSVGISSRFRFPLSTVVDEWGDRGGSVFIRSSSDLYCCTSFSRPSIRASFCASIFAPLKNTVSSESYVFNCSLRNWTSRCARFFCRSTRSYRRSVLVSWSCLFWTWELSVSTVCSRV